MIFVGMMCCSKMARDWLKRDSELFAVLVYINPFERLYNTSISVCDSATTLPMARSPPCSFLKELPPPRVTSGLQVVQDVQSLIERAVGTRTNLTKRPYDTSVTLTVHSPLVVDVLQIPDQNFELLVASHETIALDNTSISVCDSVTTLPMARSPPCSFLKELPPPRVTSGLQVVQDVQSLIERAVGTRTNLTERPYDTSVTLTVHSPLVVDVLQIPDQNFELLVASHETIALDNTSISVCDSVTTLPMARSPPCSFLKELPPPRVTSGLQVVQDVQSLIERAVGTRTNLTERPYDTSVTLTVHSPLVVDVLQIPDQNFELLVASHETIALDNTSISVCDSVTTLPMARSPPCSFLKELPPPRVTSGLQVVQDVQSLIERAVGTRTNLTERPYDTSVTLTVHSPLVVDVLQIPDQNFELLVASHETIALDNTSISVCDSVTTLPMARSPPCSFLKELPPPRVTSGLQVVQDVQSLIERAVGTRTNLTERPYDTSVTLTVHSPLVVDVLQIPDQNFELLVASHETIALDNTSISVCDSVTTLPMARSPPCSFLKELPPPRVTSGLQVVQDVQSLIERAVGTRTNLTERPYDTSVTLTVHSPLVVDVLQIPDQNFELLVASHETIALDNTSISVCDSVTTLPMARSPPCSFLKELPPPRVTCGLQVVQDVQSLIERAVGTRTNLTERPYDTSVTLTVHSPLVVDVLQIPDQNFELLVASHETIALDNTSISVCDSVTTLPMARSPPCSFLKELPPPRVTSGLQVVQDVQSLIERAVGTRTNLTERPYDTSVTLTVHSPLVVDVLQIPDQNFELLVASHETIALDNTSISVCDSVTTLPMARSPPCSFLKELPPPRVTSGLQDVQSLIERAVGTRTNLTERPYDTSVTLTVHSPLVVDVLQIPDQNFELLVASHETIALDNTSISVCDSVTTLPMARSPPCSFLKELPPPRVTSGLQVVQDVQSLIGCEVGKEVCPQRPSPETSKQGGGKLTEADRESSPVSRCLPLGVAEARDMHMRPPAPDNLMIDCPELEVLRDDSLSPHASLVSPLVITFSPDNIPNLNSTEFEFGMLSDPIAMDESMVCSREHTIDSFIAPHAKPPRILRRLAWDMKPPAPPQVDQRPTIRTRSGRLSRQPVRYGV